MGSEVVLGTQKPLTTTRLFAHAVQTSREVQEVQVILQRIQVPVVVFA